MSKDDSGCLWSCVSAYLDRTKGDPKIPQKGRITQEVSSLVSQESIPSPKRLEQKSGGWVPDFFGVVVPGLCTRWKAECWLSYTEELILCLPYYFLS